MGANWCLIMESYLWRCLHCAYKTYFFHGEMSNTSKKQVNMIRKYHNHTLQTNPEHREEDPQQQDTRITTKSKTESWSSLAWFSVVQLTFVCSAILLMFWLVLCLFQDICSNNLWWFAYWQSNCFCSWFYKSKVSCSTPFQIHGYKA